MMNLANFSLLKEDNESYTVAHPKGRHIRVSKTGLSKKAQEAVSKLKRAQGFAEGGEVEGEKKPETIDIQVTSPEQLASYQPQNPAAVMAPPPENFGEPDGPVASGAAAELQPAAPQTPVAPVPGAPAAPSAETLSAKALGEEKSAIGAGAEAEAVASKESQKALQQYQARVASVPTPQATFQAHQQKDQELQNAIMNQKIDPNRLFNNMGTGQKVTSGIAMILGGLGAGLSGGPNKVVEMMQHAIEKDIDAQKSDKDQKMTLWKMNRENAQNEISANLATENQMMSVVKAKMLAAATGAQGAQAKARVAPVVAQIDQQIALNNYKKTILDQQANGGISHVDPSQIVPLMVKNPEMQKQVYGEIKDAQNTRQMSGSIIKSFEEAVKENTALKTGFGVLRTPASVLSFHQNMQPTFASLEGTVRQAAMDNTFKNLTPMPGDSEHTIQQKREAVHEYLKSKMSAPVAKGNGIDLNRFESTAPHPDPDQIQTMNGIKYKKVPGGWQKAG